jgi:hypothetical protein
VQGAGAAAGFRATGSLANDFVMASMGGAVPNDVFPKTGGALIGKGDATLQPPDDFDGLLRGSAADVGAYAFNPSGRPKWPLAASIKNIMNGAGPSDAGASSSGGASSGGSSEAGSGAASSSGAMGTPAASVGEDSGGCGCRSAGRDRSFGGVLLFGLALFLIRRRAGLSSRR